MCLRNALLTLRLLLSLWRSSLWYCSRNQLVTFCMLHRSRCGTVLMSVSSQTSCRGPCEKILTRFRWNLLRGSCMQVLKMPCKRGACMKALVWCSGELLCKRSRKITLEVRSMTVLVGFSYRSWHVDLNHVSCRVPLWEDLAEILVKSSKTSKQWRSWGCPVREVPVWKLL